MTPPSRQDDGNVRAPTLSRAVCLVVHVVAVAKNNSVYGGGLFTVKVVCLPAPLLDRLLVERVWSDLADSTRQLVRDTALLFSQD